jgi:hypothetical protein
MGGSVEGNDALAGEHGIDGLVVEEAAVVALYVEDLGDAERLVSPSAGGRDPGFPSGDFLRSMLDDRASERRAPGEGGWVIRATDG